MNIYHKGISIFCFVVACIYLQGCIIGDGCSVSDQSTEFVDSKWVGSTDPDTIAYKFKCTGNVWPTTDFVGGTSTNEIIELVMKEVYTSTMTIANARSKALSIAKAKFEALVKTKNPTTQVVDGIVCEEKYINQPPIGSCKVSDNNSSGSSPTPDPGPVDPGPGPGQGLTP
jgi:hypothetical protein